ncbi:MAG: thioredoxin [Gammaproteobacteria bacterium]|nr:thioredoxin [Gammaproteobacteria bacterium]
MMSEFVMETGDEQFQVDVLDSKIPVLVDFWAPWCGPCRMLAPIVEEVAAQFVGRIKFLKVNVDDNQETPGKYGVRGIPALMLFREGEMVASKVGALTKSQLTAFLEENM